MMGDGDDDGVWGRCDGSINAGWRMRGKGRCQVLSTRFLIPSLSLFTSFCLFPNPYPDPYPNPYCNPNKPNLNLNPIQSSKFDNPQAPSSRQEHYAEITQGTHSRPSSTSAASQAHCQPPPFPHSRADRDLHTYLSYPEFHFKSKSDTM